MSCALSLETIYYQHVRTTGVELRLSRPVFFYFSDDLTSSRREVPVDRKSTYSPTELHYKHKVYKTARQRHGQKLLNPIIQLRIIGEALRIFRFTPLNRIRCTRNYIRILNHFKIFIYGIIRYSTNRSTESTTYFLIWFSFSELKIYFAEWKESQYECFNFFENYFDHNQQKYE